MILNREFLDYDPLLVDLRNKFLVEASMLISQQVLQEEVPIANQTWYIKWKGETAILLKNNFAQYSKFASDQMKKYNPWLKDNAEYFNPSNYPIDPSCTLNKAPDYRTAIYRIKEPIVNALNDINLSRIEVEDDTDGIDNNNRYFMKSIIKSYQGNGDDFLDFAKTYYSGEDRTQDLSAQELTSMMANMYNYCMNYNQMVHVLQNQLQSIISFLNRDPVSGQQNDSQAAEKDLQGLNAQQQSGNKTASSNPMANVSNTQTTTVQHASADWLMMRESVLVEYANVATSSNSNQASTIKQSSTPNITQGAKRSNTTSGNVDPSKNTPYKNNDPHGTPRVQQDSKSSEKTLAMKRKQVACNIVKDVFNCKVTAAGKIYRDYITVLRTHVATIIEQQKKNSNKNQ
jgi:hypothetical protein